MLSGLDLLQVAGKRVLRTLILACFLLLVLHGNMTITPTFPEQVPPGPSSVVGQ